MVLSYIRSHNTYNIFQLAYHPGHSTETALLKVSNHLIICLNKRNMSVLALHDFSSAFDHCPMLADDLLMLSFNGFYLI